MIELIQGSQKKQVEFRQPQNMLAFLREQGVEITAVCSGNQTCGKCRVRLLSGAPEPTTRERDLFSEAQLKQGDRLACAHEITEGMQIILDEQRDYHSVSSFCEIEIENSLAKIEPEGYGVAIDLGTTTVVAGLVSLAEKKIVGVSSFLNPQSSYGADVISRIQATKQLGVKPLQKVLQERLKKEIQGLCRGEGLELESLRSIVIAGNTTMTYLLQGLDPAELAVAPFFVSHPSYREIDARELLALDSPARVRIFPCLSAYVGGDIAAGIYAYGNKLRSAQPAFMLDLGTNGEILLVHQDKIVCAATAAGPAFEGAGIQWGVGGIAGAISEVRFLKDRVVVETIGDADPIGICGSGIIDVVAEGIRTAQIDETGRLPAESLTVVEAVEPIVFTQKDVREVQLAKAAIAAGIRILSDKMEVEMDQVNHLYLAGGFGQHLHLKHAARIGLIPHAWEKRTTTIGNASFAGAYKALFDENLEATLTSIKAGITYLELSKEKSFNLLYVQEMQFKKSDY